MTMIPDERNTEKLIDATTAAISKIAAGCDDLMKAFHEAIGSLPSTDGHADDGRSSDR